MAKKHASPTCEPMNMGEILADLHSSDEVVRARAVRAVCPCRLGWNAFEQCMQIVHWLQKDPSPLVRGAAQHVIEESYELTSGGVQTTPQQVKNDMVATRVRLRWSLEETKTESRRDEKPWRDSRRNSRS